jgi:hypothetical protein
MSACTCSIDKGMLHAVGCVDALFPKACNIDAVSAFWWNPQRLCNGAGDASIRTPNV